MKTMLAGMMLILPLIAVTAGAGASAPLALEFDEGVETWRVVVDGVMGGRSSGRVALAAPGVLRFTGDLSLENNGGFSQIRTNVSGESFEGAEGLELRVRGDGREYQFNVRCSNVRMMAGGFQQNFQTTEGEWLTVRLPFDGFRLYSFGRRVPNAPALERDKIESIGVTLADKNAGPFALEIDFIRTFGGASRAPATGEDLVSVAREAGLDTLLKLVAAAELELPADERITIFAPTDEAFASLPDETVQQLLSPEGRDALRAILTYHVARSGISSTDLLSRRSVETLNGQRLVVDASGAVSIGGAGVLAVDVPFDGGIVHVIDTVLMPELRSIGELASASEGLGTLAAAVAAAGLESQLSNENGPWTVFAPVDSAFAALPASTLESLLLPENRSDLVSVLSLHPVPGRLYANELLRNQRARTLLGTPIEFGLESGRLRVNGASFVKTDIEAGNGVVHLIDTVLLPTQSEAISAEMSAEGARLCELAISRGAPFFNAGQHEACAAVYEVAIEAMVALGGPELGRAVVQRLQMGLAEAQSEDNWTDRAWIYRAAIDEAYAWMLRQAEPGSTSASR